MYYKNTFLFSNINHSTCKPYTLVIIIHNDMLLIESTDNVRSVVCASSIGLASMVYAGILHHP